MKVLMVIDRMMVGGAEQVFEDLIILMKQHVNLTALTICDSEPEQIERISKHVPTIELGRQHKYSFRSLLRCRNILSNYDVVHVHMKHTLRYIQLVKLSILTLKVVYHEHHSESELNFLKTIFLFKPLKPNQFIGVKSSVCEWAIRFWKMSPESVSLLYNLPSRTLVYNHSNNSPSRKYGILLVGNIKPVKNQSFALQFAQKVNEEIHLVGKIQDEKYYQGFRDAEGYKLRTNINSASEVLQDYKFGLCTSISESGPLVVLEYFVAGLPFLAHKIGGIAEVLSEYVPEFFIDNLDLDEWIKRYDELNKNYQRIPKGLIDEVLEKEFNRETYAQQLMNIYKQCHKNS